MLFQGPMYEGVNDTDIDVLAAIATHVDRDRGGEIQNHWKMLGLMKVQDALMVATMPMSELMKRIPVDEALRAMTSVTGEARQMVRENEQNLNPVMKKYTIGVGVQYTAALVKEDHPQREAMILEEEIFGRLHLGSEHLKEAVHHVIIRHLNGLFYSLCMPNEGEWEEDFPAVRIDSKEGAHQYGTLGEGLTSIVETMAQFTELEVEARG